ncbi:MAG TPA: S9 family peptidase [Chloroflexia bacterium]|nr:S9 family peptidase [Chloroflexia bacterium]
MTEKLTIAQAARYPRPGISGPKAFQFDQAGQKIYYLYTAEDELEQQLRVYDIASGEEKILFGEVKPESGTGAKLSREEELRRERKRTRETGVTSFELAGEQLLIPSSEGLYIRRNESAEITLLAGTADAQDAHFSPDGTKIAFVRAGELQIYDLQAGTTRTLTTGADESRGITNGLAEYAAQEEMDRSEGYWWSPDGQFIAYAHVDSSNIPAYIIAHQGQAEGIEYEEHRYPFAGQPNARVTLGVISLEGGETRWMNLSSEEDFYLARVAWRPSGDLAVQILSRDQQHLSLLALNLQTGQATTLIEEQSQPWLNLNNDTRFLKSGEILWSSERSGFRHLYLYDAQGRELRTLTSGEWQVISVTGLDEEKREVYFIATLPDVLERQLFVVSLDSGEPTRLTRETGWHECAVSPSFNWLVNRYSNIEQSPVVNLYKLAEGKPEKAATLYQSNGITVKELGLQAPELTSFTTRDGSATLYAAVYNPPELEPGRRYPLIVSVYGGPHAQRVANQWDLTVDLRAQYLAQHGFVVLKVDNRGSFNRGLKFEGAIARDMGRLEVSDQVDGVNFLAQRDYVDAGRVGIYGWSYGGYMTCMALLRAPEVFKVGVAGAPVTHWDGYDTTYTERYMSTPADNPQGYEDSAVVSHVENLEGKLLLVHGMVDENVHFRHTARLIDALTEAQKDYDLLIFPEERHMPRDAKGLEYQERRIVEYFQRNL